MLEVEDYAIVLPNDIIKTRGVERSNLRSKASHKFGCSNSPSCKSISCTIRTINVLFELTIERPTLEKVN